MNIYNLKGKVIGKRDLDAAIFGITPNESVVHEVVVAELAGARQGTASTKSRGEVKGGGRKIRRQKGTGMARQGSNRSPQWVGGGIVHGPRPRNFGKKVNKKVLKLALRSVLSSKASSGSIFVLGDYKIDSPKTKEVVSFLESMKIKKPLFVLNDLYDLESENLYFSARNLKDSTVIDVVELAAYWLLKYDNVIITPEALDRLERILK